VVVWLLGLPVSDEAFSSSTMDQTVELLNTTNSDDSRVNLNDYYALYIGPNTTYRCMGKSYPIFTYTQMPGNMADANISGIGVCFQSNEKITNKER
jgi:hypothetical protein